MRDSYQRTVIVTAISLLILDPGQTESDRSAIVNDRRQAFQVDWFNPGSGVLVTVQGKARRCSVAFHSNELQRGPAPA